MDIVRLCYNEMRERIESKAILQNENDKLFIEFESDKMAGKVVRVVWRV